MPLPASVPVGTVTGRWYTPSGGDASGTIAFILMDSIEIPDDPDGVVLPLSTTVTLATGAVSQVLPAGSYQVFVAFSNGTYRRHKFITVVAGETLNLPDLLD